MSYLCTRLAIFAEENNMAIDIHYFHRMLSMMKNKKQPLGISSHELLTSKIKQLEIIINQKEPDFNFLF